MSTSLPTGDRAESDAAADRPLSLIQPADLRLLIVDNEAAHARAMTESLEKIGYQCEVATRGPDAAKMIERETYDIIITDMVMNEVDGMQLLALARQDRKSTRLNSSHVK